ncbi:MAG TPA: hypothetical protein VD883_04135 [Candidatus Omnitrophota bacterium]|nr:hypothetical protein [Candidatus Omnitrophota bacterium]
MLTKPLVLLGASVLFHGALAAPFVGIEPAAKKPPAVIYVSYVKTPSPDIKKAPVLRKHAPKINVRTPQPAAPTQARELLADPKRKAVFSSYYTDVKEKIEKVIRRKGGAMGKGDVQLQFILKQDGSLEGVWAADGTPGTGQTEKRFAVQCVQEAAAFDPFPKELRSERIAFTLTLHF